MKEQSMKELGSGAEASVYLATRRTEHGFQRVVIKERIKKEYRLAQLDDELRKNRTKREANILKKLPIPGPRLIESDDTGRIVMEYLDGIQLKKVLDRNVTLARCIGQCLAKLHDHDIIHGDLTTSNMILKDATLYFIDFGLSFTSKEPEHKAVDIHLFKQALESKHYKVYETAYAEFLEGYKKSKNARVVLERLNAVERRGRNKAKY